MKEANVLYTNLNTKLPYPPSMLKYCRQDIKIVYRMYALPRYIGKRYTYYTYAQYFIKDFDSTRVATTLYGDSRQLKD